MKNLRKMGAWRPVPLPLQFHLKLEAGDWQAAFLAYKAHNFNAPPIDTYELLKIMLTRTVVNVEDVKQRFERDEKMKLAKMKRTPEQIEWNLFWDALNN